MNELPNWIKIAIDELAVLTDTELDQLHSNFAKMVHYVEKEQEKRRAEAKKRSWEGLSEKFGVTLHRGLEYSVTQEIHDWLAEHRPFTLEYRYPVWSENQRARIGEHSDPFKQNGEYRVFGECFIGGHYWHQSHPTSPAIKGNRRTTASIAIPVRLIADAVKRS